MFRLAALSRIIPNHMALIITVSCFDTKLGKGQHSIDKGKPPITDRGFQNKGAHIHQVPAVFMEE
jgi:hypothetical protein